MRVLVLGGTRFVGRYIVDAALDRGYEVTLFNRGVTGPQLFPECEHRVGDRRAGDLKSLETGTWDVVIDVCGYAASDVRGTAVLLRDRVDRYCFVSTGAVYSNKALPQFEDSSLVDPKVDEPTEEDLVAFYAELKVACELELAKQFRGKLSIIRPGIVVGPHDPTDRFTYWVRRIASGGRVLGPPRARQPVQIVHGRDQAEMVINVASSPDGGVFNCAGPCHPICFSELTAACAEAAGSNIEVLWDGPSSLPLATPSDGSHDGAYRLSTLRAEQAGLTHRPLVEICSETLAWDRARGQPSLRSGMPTADDEEKLIRAALSRGTKSRAL